ncbi:MAG: glycine cleavage system aminomethyltransferase GcvT [Candidatus Dormibacteria bacterium]
MYDRHLAAGAKLVDFAGYSMPIQYRGMREEHLGVRTRAGLFDLSHMGEVHCEGADALAGVDRLVANDVARLRPGRALYGVMCREDGGIVDDVIVYRDADDALMVVVNAACRDKDLAWMRAHLEGQVTVDDRSESTALLAVQGPEAIGIVSALSEDPVADLRPFTFTIGEVAGYEARISRTGYTGEDGVELYVDAELAPGLWDALLEAGAARGLSPAGLGARDTLRLEAGLRLYGQDMDESIDLLSAGLGWTVKLDRADFVGREALLAHQERGAPRRFIGLELDGRNIARHGQTVVAGGTSVGVITSGTYSFSLGHGIATASVTPAAAADGVELAVDIRGTAVPARRVTLPFYKRPAAKRPPEE